MFKVKVFTCDIRFAEFFFTIFVVLWYILKYSVPDINFATPGDNWIL